MMIRLYRYILLLILSQGALLSGVDAQETRITGKVTDAATGEPIPFVNIYFRNTTMGSTSDLNGLFLLKTTQPTDSIYASAVGYQTLKMAVKKGVSQEINFAMAEFLYCISRSTGQT